MVLTTSEEQGLARLTLLSLLQPRAEPYEFSLPSGEWPSGMLGRGTYSAKVRREQGCRPLLLQPCSVLRRAGLQTKVSDDDGGVHAQLAWSFEVKREWE